VQGAKRSRGGSPGEHLELVERKLELFPNDLRRITGWDARKKNGQPYVTVSAVVNVPDD